ncbi:hypothetical protein [Rhizobium sp. BT-175]|uniref:hypothetical protein n=1 Tax=Rhizobium sp. BT-175 TaxID=2986929 RepID=UPI0022368F1F|nr:hypothetical protein [Rhizobium sp. BT-175]MCV9947667.1 hypothetical protein [Rhizobium sp. BT-175]
MSNITERPSNALPAVLSTEGAPLPPLLSPEWERAVTFGKRDLRNSLETHGSPLHVLAPEICAANLRSMAAAIGEFGVSGQLFYAFKANKSVAFVEAAAQAGFGIDVASEHEHKLAAQHSAEGTAISLSGPVKGASWLRRAVAEGCLIGIDSFEELQFIRSLLLKERPRQLARITIRVNMESAKCRFGVDPEQLPACGKLLVENNILLKFEGFAFHLNGYAVGDRINATRRLLDTIDSFASIGLESYVLNIGGGLPVQYVAEEDFSYFIKNHHDAVSYLGHAPGSFYPYGGQPTAAEWLKAFLSANGASGTIASELRSRGLTLLVEPGRAALDQAGASLFQIGAVKKGKDSTTLFLNGTSFNACETWFQSEFLCDPLILSEHAADADDCREHRYYLAGHSCLGDDMISRRAFTSSRRLRVGDVLLFANTAGYQMDLLENNFHHHPFPHRSVLEPVSATANDLKARTAA